MHRTRILEQSEANVMFNRPAPSRGGMPTYEERGWDHIYREIEIEIETSMHRTRILEQSEANVMFNRPAPSRGGMLTYEERGWDHIYREIEIETSMHITRIP